MLAALMAAGPVQAAENGVINYSPGAAGSNNLGFPDFPGVFALQQFDYSSADGLYGNDGKKLPTEYKNSVYVSTTRILLSYPFELPGNGRLYSQAIFPVVGLNTTFLGQKSSTTNLSNITLSPVIAKWTVLDGLAVVGGLDIVLNNGGYDASKFNVNTGYSSVIPVFGLRYEKENGLDLAVTNRILFNQRNETTKYLTGNIYAADFQAGWNLNHRLKLGVVGGYYQQISDDSSPFGVAAGGNRSEYLGLGPSIVYQTEFLGRPLAINLNYQIGAYARNTSKPSTLWLNFAIPLYVPAPPSKS